MNQFPLYLPRKLLDAENIYTEKELPAVSSFIVVLAEPGGGKTRLMNSLADRLGTSCVTANAFRHLEASSQNEPLVIDAFDELAKVDQSGIYQLLATAKKTNPTHVIISSRSSEWDTAATHAFQELLGHAPLVVRLCEFDDAEQRAIFEDHVGEENFSAFQAEVARFDLEMLLPNPQFLKLFADAYIESEKHFVDKRSIFAQAVERLAKEANNKVVNPRPVIPTAQKVAISSEVFTKLLLSGAEGVCISEATESLVYPLLASLLNGDSATTGILATQLFKPGDSEDQHRPVHKIVAEYCAAGYLTKRIAAPSDPLTLLQCIPIIAPNFTVRDELRGVLGWMASLGNKPIEEAAIELDPYGVLANGDPSQLEPSSKRLLVKKLKETEHNDPYFRRGDYWRRFSVAGFFTNEVVDEIKPLLARGADGHLRDLVLELLRGSPEVGQLGDELRHLTLATDENVNTRLLASRCLLEIPDHNHQASLNVLISESSETSLRVAAEIIESMGCETFQRAYLADYLRACASLYPGHKEPLEHVIGSRYFVKTLIAELDLMTTEWLLDEFTKDLACKCGENAYECDCRNGMSKIIGGMLDHYFEMASPPFDPKRVWKWVGNLNFHEHKAGDQSKAVRVFQEDHCLRQGMIAHVFESLTDRDEIFNTKVHMFSGHKTHSGLSFQSDDYKFVVDLAFHTNNPDLWACFMARHQYHRNKKDNGINSLRRHMREQALEKPAFLREWVKSNRTVAQRLEKEKRSLHAKHIRRVKRRRRQQEDIRAANIKYVQDNRELVESGRHWGCLVRFAELVLMKPDKIEHEFGDEILVRSALRNCLHFIDECVPDLKRLAELQCVSKGLQSEMILYAACLEILHSDGHLGGVALHHLRALRANINMGYSAVSTEERKALKTEVDRLIFPDIKTAESFLREYVEPQLVKSDCSHPEVWLLRGDEAFSALRNILSIEWLRRFRDLELDPLDTLFETAAEHGNRDELKTLIEKRCAEIMSVKPQSEENEADTDQVRKFWLVRAFYFLDDIPETYWNLLKNDKRTLLAFHERSGGFNHTEYPSWPKLTSRKVEAVLDAFIEKWPKVDLPSHFGTGSPEEENAYRFLTEVIWSINSDQPEDALPVLGRLLGDQRFADLHKDLMSIRATQMRKMALKDFRPPTPEEIVNLLDNNEIVTVEGLRQLVIDELFNFQKAIDGGEYNTASHFYEHDNKVNELRASEIIAERLSLKLEPQGILVTQEHQLKAAKRSDFTVTKMIGGKRRLLVAEVKGQWHRELYSAAAAQLSESYSIHPDAEQQGIFLALWFGAEVEVAGRVQHNIGNASELKNSIEETLPPELSGLIDVFVLDVARSH